MQRFEIAHIREQGVDLVIVPLDDQFRYKTTDQKQQAAYALQVCASQAGLAGTVVPVWDDGGGRMGFLAPPNWHPFFSSIDLSFVAMNINRELSCG